MLKQDNNKEENVKKGFTLVEILVVLVIIGILVALILPNALKTIDQGNIKSAAATLRNIDTAIKLCYSQTQNWTSCDSIALLEGDATGTATGTSYMDQLPNGGNDPWGGAYTLTGDDTTGWQSTKTTIFPSWPDLTNVSRV